MNSKHYVCSGDLDPAGNRFETFILFFLFVCYYIYMKKIFIIIFALILGMNSALAYELSNEELLQNISIQNLIDSIAYDMLNVAQIKQRMIFTYDKESKKKLLKCNESLTKREILIYGDAIQKIADKNELAALIAREIVKADSSYWGYFKGYIGSAQVRFAPKKYEIYFDSAAVDLMVKAGYNPVGMITFLHKVYPQRRTDFISTSNLTSKRVMYVYEYIYKTYPEFLVNNAYRENKYYQNFLLTSTENRAKFYEKMRTHSDEKIKYE